MHTGRVARAASRRRRGANDHVNQAVCVFQPWWGCRCHAGGRGRGAAGRRLLAAGPTVRRGHGGSSGRVGSSSTSSS
eukprot:1750489-Prymnesium_polylepis.1